MKIKLVFFQTGELTDSTDKSMKIVLAIKLLLTLLLKK
jgi:hypothetical protein